MIGKVIALALIGVLAVVALRQVKPELAIFAGLAASALIILEIVNGLTGILNVFETLGGESSANNVLYKTIIKIIGIGYITEYTASVCEDYGSQSIAKKVQLAGKVSIFTLAIPIVLSIIEAVGLLAGK
jgi:Stage III sporulation protein AC/AD protein family.